MLELSHVIQFTVAPYYDRLYRVPYDFGDSELDLDFLVGASPIEFSLCPQPFILILHLLTGENPGLKSLTLH